MDWAENIWILISFLFWIGIIINILYLFYASIKVYLGLKQSNDEMWRESLKKKYSIMVHLIRTDQSSAILRHVNYFVLRTVLAIVCIFWNGKPIYQLTTLVIANMFAAIIQVEVSPAPTLGDNKHLFFDQVIIIAILECLYCCTDLVTKGSSRYAVGYFIIILTCISILIHILVLVSKTFKKMKLWFKIVNYVRKKHPGRMTEFAKS